MAAPFQLALVQMSMSDNLSDNLEKAATKVEEAARAGARVVCLPEMFRSRYFCQVEDAGLFDLAETVPGPSTERFTGIAKQHNVAVVVPIFEKRAPGLYHNSVVVIDGGGRNAGMYRKMHIPDDPCFYEKFYFTPGDLGFKAFETQVGTIGTLICWDQWFPEGARLTAMQGAGVLFYPTAIGWHPAEKAQFGAAQRDAWQTIQRSHAIANGVFVASVNRVGHEPGAPGMDGLEFWGTSFVADPMGTVLVQGSTDREETLHCEIDPARTEEVRRGWPFFRDRRIDAYSDLTQRFLDRPKP